MELVREDSNKLNQISILCKELGLGQGGNPYVSGEIPVAKLLNLEYLVLDYNNVDNEA